MLPCRRRPFPFLNATLATRHSSHPNPPPRAPPLSAQTHREAPQAGIFLNAPALREAGAWRTLRAKDQRAGKDSNSTLSYASKSLATPPPLRSWAQQRHARALGHGFLTSPKCA